MEKHRCNPCFRRFANGRALGGHMRSHMMNLPIVPPKPKPPPPPPPTLTQLEEDDTGSGSCPSPSSSSSSSSEEENDEKGLCDGLRVYPKRSVRLVDPEFSYAAAAGSSSLVLQDRESEAESSRNPTLRRSKRHQGSTIDHHRHHIRTIEEADPLSSVSETTAEEDVAFCLLMLSRDKWTTSKDNMPKKIRPDEKSREASDDSDKLFNFSKSSNNRGKFKCETCNKVFKSYQALGGHRASHKKIRVVLGSDGFDGAKDSVNGNPSDERKIYECSVCFRVFASGQALGGHKRSHVIGIETRAGTEIKADPKKPSTHTLIDLNLPAPINDDETSQIALSAVSDANL
ncbi:hypothetical protein Nepgr_002455 [Nepenthes gracilis]|uniref:C2H2-type domain-containing protein n=1 Tax=Nepenthes gracilis TaxID=150966 RepID=A0AAD3P6U9_NEPGR|nr:hypothetical protein Nepgr_002455 [Nepenthes gracilis]